MREESIQDSELATHSERHLKCPQMNMQLKQSISSCGMDAFTETVGQRPISDAVHRFGRSLVVILAEMAKLQFQINH